VPEVAGTFGVTFSVWFPVAAELDVAALPVVPVMVNGVDSEAAACGSPLVVVAVDSVAPDPPPPHAARTRDITRRAG